jgi:hypothetical protein
MRRAIVVSALCLAVAAGVAGSIGAATLRANAWVTSRSVAQRGLVDRFANVASASCTPDRTSATLVHGNTRYWQRFWCQGQTYDGLAFRLRFKATGQCGSCWTITNLTGTGVTHLRTKAIQKRSSPSPSGGSCPSGYYRNSSGHCVHRPVTTPSAPPGATAQCVDGTYSFSEHASGTCSHHGGVARWINHP